LIKFLEAEHEFFINIDTTIMSINQQNKPFTTLILMKILDLIQ